MKTLDDLGDLRGKRVLVRADLNVPLDGTTITDFTAVVGRAVTVDEVNDAFRVAASSGPLSRVLEYATDPLVSSDIVTDPASCIFDAGLTKVIGDQVKVVGWYDNEWGYSNRLVDLVGYVGARL